MTDQTRPAGGADRGIVDVLAGAVAGSAILPFLQALATKSGEDVYAKLKDVLTRRGRTRAKAELAESGTITVVSPDSRLVVRLPASMDAAVVERLENLPVPTRRDGWLVVSWDAATGRWIAEEADEPPTDPPHVTT